MKPSSLSRKMPRSTLSGLPEEGRGRHLNSQNLGNDWRVGVAISAKTNRISGQGYPHAEPLNKPCQRHFRRIGRVHARARMAGFLGGILACPGVGSSPAWTGENLGGVGTFRLEPRGQRGMGNAGVVRCRELGIRWRCCV